VITRRAWPRARWSCSRNCRRRISLGFSYYYRNNQYDAALREFEIARNGLPNSMEVFLAIGAIQRRQGHWASSNASLEKPALLGPKDTWALQNLPFNYEMQRDFPPANHRARAQDSTRRLHHLANQGAHRSRSEG
jgi:tetratricopeptide (TPR) repeat protein